MKRQQTAPNQDLSSLAEDAKALLAATAGVAEDKVVAAREKLSAALERGREAWDSVQEQASEGVKVADKAIRKNPYQSIGIAFGVGALLGILLTRRNRD